MAITPESLADAMDAVYVQNDGYRDGVKFQAPTKWFVIDGRTAEPDVNWPGELISEHDTAEAVRIGRAQAIIAMASR